LEQRSYRIDAQHGDVFGRRFESADSFFNGGRGNGSHFGAGFSGHPLGERFAGGDGGGAAARKEAGLGHAIVLKARGEAEHVAASGIGDVDFHRRRAKFTGMMRVPEIAEQSLAVHSYTDYRRIGETGKVAAEEKTQVVEVVAAVIEHDGRILIGQRKPGGRHALKWEFPGGKVEPGEDPRAALARELREELGIEAVIGRELEAYDFLYKPGSITRLMFFHVEEFAGAVKNLDFHALAWEPRENLPAYDFLEGDVEFVKRLAGIQ
jgi:8-oxo-dGTP diphosphatase